MEQCVASGARPQLPARCVGSEAAESIRGFAAADLVLAEHAVAAAWNARRIGVLQFGRQQ